jgi:hypothetical protein
MSSDLDDPYKNAIGTLADGARMAPASAARIERELLNAFTEHHAAVTQAPAARRRVEWRPWAAAALLAIAASIGVWRFRSDVTVVGVTDTAAPQKLPVAAHDSASTTPQAVALPVRPISIPARHAPSVRRAGPRRETVKPVGFVELPNAAGLPEFESGTIIRMELPVASLPAYGIEIPGAADERLVEADLLVGQDGLTRAIRLVASANDAASVRDSHSKQE